MNCEFGFFSFFSLFPPFAVDSSSTVFPINGCNDRQYMFKRQQNQFFFIVCILVAIVMNKTTEIYTKDRIKHDVAD